MSSLLEKTTKKVLDDFYAKTRKSAELHDKAIRYMPGGDTRSTVYYAPYPVYIQKATGCRLYDHEGNEYIDFLNNYTSLIHGHAHPAVSKAAKEAIDKGTIYGAPAEIQILHAEHLCNRVQSLDTVRYCNSGTEATMFALRAARAFMKRDIIIKIDGGYHGTHDVAEINVHPDLNADKMPNPVIDPGIPACTAEGVRIAPFNNLEAMEELLKANKGQVAGVIVEPIMGASGLIKSNPGYLKGLRELTDKYDTLLIFDEVITFRFHEGGYQAIEGVTPDLTCMAKILGGGLPVGAFGGRRDIMDVFNPSRPGFVGHGGTFNGNCVTMAAGLVTLELYDQKAVDRLNDLSNRFRKGYKNAIKSNGIKADLSGFGSLMSLHFGESLPENAKDSVSGAKANFDLTRLLHLLLVNRGVHTATRAMYVLSTAMTEADIDRAISCVEESLDIIKPVIAEGWPHLLVG